MRSQALLQCTKWLDILYCLSCAELFRAVLFCALQCCAVLCCALHCISISFLSLLYIRPAVGCVVLCDEIFPGQSTKADLTSSPSTVSIAQPVLYVLCSMCCATAPHSDPHPIYSALMLEEKTHTHIASYRVIYSAQLRQHSVHTSHRTQCTAHQCTHRTHTAHHTHRNTSRRAQH